MQIGSFIFFRQTGWVFFFHRFPGPISKKQMPGTLLEIRMCNTNCFGTGIHDRCICFLLRYALFCFFPYFCFWGFGLLAWGHRRDGPGGVAVGSRGREVRVGLKSQVRRISHCECIWVYFTFFFERGLGFHLVWCLMDSFEDEGL